MLSLVKNKTFPKSPNIKGFDGLTTVTFIFLAIIYLRFYFYIFQKCPYCSGLHKRTTKEYIKECKECGYDLPIESYINVDTKVKHKCNQCGYIYSQRPSQHLNDIGCPKCAGTMKLTMKQYIERCKELGIDLPIRGEKYINNKTKIKHMCRQCGNIYEQAPKPHLQGQGCPACGALKRAESNRKTTCNPI